MQIGPYSVTSVVLDRFRLDGGAMFGVVPKPLWERRIGPDSQNRIQLASRSLLIEGNGRRILVDLGCGSKYEQKQKDIYQFEPQLSPPLEIQFGDVTDVILTHLHFDHAGGVTRMNEAGEAVLSFPKAMHHLQVANFERAQNPGIRERATYFPENIEPLKRGKLSLTTDAQEILPGITVFEVNGHTDGMQWVLVRDGSAAVAFAADLVPTAHHLPVPYVMGYDLCATTSMKEKENLLSQAVQCNWLIAFCHDADTAAVRVDRDKKGTYIAAETLATL